MSKIKFNAIIVLYNCSLEESDTFLSIKDEKDINIILCDNSTKDYDNFDVSKKYNVNYISMNGNVGLSKAYNAAINSLNSKDDNNYICIFDDDTKIPSNYFSEMKIAIEKNNCDIFLPVVYDGEEIMSPFLINGKFYKKITDINNIKGVFSGINSGMLIKSSVFENYCYDEGLFLDYVDHHFMHDMLQQKRIISLVKSVVLNQNFSSSTDNLNGALIRFHILKHDAKYHYKDSLTSYYYLYWRRIIKISLKYRTFRFFTYKGVK